MATGDDMQKELKMISNVINTTTGVKDEIAPDEGSIITKTNEEIATKGKVEDGNDCFMEGFMEGREHKSFSMRMSDNDIINWISRPLDIASEVSSIDDSGVAGSLDSVEQSIRATHRTDKERCTKLGHRRVRDDGQVTYKNILTSRIVNSIQLGIKHAIAQLSASNRDLLMQDFMTVESVPFSPSGSPSHGYSRFVFKTYAPVAFGYFRDLFGIKSENYLASFCQKPLKELSNSGNSGSIFYLTGDDKFIVKTTQSKECAFLQSLLPGYYLNLHQNPNTLLPKYFGLYCYKCDMKKIRLVAMNNILPTWIKMSQTYDLKGATYKNRETTEVAKTEDGSMDQQPPPTYKDLDFLKHHPSGIFLNNETYNTLIKTIKRDCTVLESFKIMDYSLLLGISKVESAISTPKEHKKRFFTRHSTDQDNEQYNCGPNIEHVTLDGLEQKLDRFDSAQFSMITDLKKQGSPSHSSIVRPAEEQSYLFDTSDPLSNGGIPAFNSEGEPILIYIGIIDILQSYKFKKKMEHAFKSLIHDGDTISVHNPKYYSKRFQKFMSESVFKRLSPTLNRKCTKSKTTKPNVHQHMLSPTKETII